jgi:hypothetical protein
VKDWPGRVAFVLAAFVAGGWATALVLASTPWTDTISETGANLLATVGGVLAGALATYLGASYEQTRSTKSPGRPTGDEDDRGAPDPP